MTTLLGHKKAERPGRSGGDCGQLKEGSGWAITFVLACLLAVATPLRTAVGQCPRQWVPESGLPGIDGAAYAMAVFDDDGGDTLYVAGSFTIAGDIFAANIAKWDGSNWSAVGSGVDSAVYALTIFDDGSGPALYVGGSFASAGGVKASRIAKWDGSSWSGMGSGMDNSVRTLTVFDDGGGPALHAGGEFTTAGGVSANRIAKWDGSNWSALGSGMNNTVSGLAVLDDGGGPALYAGGGFTTAGGVSAKRVARWNGASWSALGSGTSGYGSNLTVFDDGSGPSLYATGTYRKSPSAPDWGSIHKWNPSSGSWSTVLEPSPDFGVFSELMVFDDGSGPTLYAATGGSIAKWTPGSPESWSSIGPGVYGGISALAAFDDGTGLALYAGTANLAKWNPIPPASWSSVGGTGINSSVYALTVFDDGAGPALYAGGTFTAAGSVSASRIAMSDGSTWSALGSGVVDIGSYASIETLMVFDDGGGPALYAGGQFGTAGGVSANGVAMWNGSTWSTLGSGMTGEYGYDSVYALTVFDDGSGEALYAGGMFTAAGGVSANRVAKWDGSNWSALGSGMQKVDPYSPHAKVFALAAFDDGGGPALYAGGDFTSAGGVTANKIAKWDGSSWSTLGTGVQGGSSSSVSALAVFDDGSGPALYAAGRFTTAGGVSVNNIAKWDGSSWSALGSGVNSGVAALTVYNDGSGPALYVGGSFTEAGGVSANNITKWDGSSWSPLGSGMNSSVSALTVFDDGGGPALYAGGSFTVAGGVVSARLAKWACARRGDMNEDAVVDLSDFAMFFDCFAGPSQRVSETDCGPGDVNWNDLIDLFDFATFQQAFGQ